MTLEVQALGPRVMRKVTSFPARPPPPALRQPETPTDSSFPGTPCRPGGTWGCDFCSVEAFYFFHPSQPLEGILKAGILLSVITASRGPGWN